MPPRKPDVLTLKEARFVERFLVHGNATAAAIEAGYSERTAEQIAYQLQQRPRVARALARGRGQLAEAAGIDAVEVLEEVAALAFSDVMDYVEVVDERQQSEGKAPPGFAREGLEAKPSTKVTTVRRLQLRDLRQTDTRAIQELRILPTGEVRLKLHPKAEALDKLCKHLGIYAPERHEHSGPGGGPIEVSDAKARLAERLSRLAARPDPGGAGGSDGG